MTYKEYISEAIKANKRCYYLNEEVKNNSKAFNKGIYIYTDEDHYTKEQYKIGQTINGESRIFDQARDASRTKPIIIIDTIESTKVELNNDYDVVLHNILEDRFNCKIVKFETFSKSDKANSTEWLTIKDSNPSDMVLKAIQFETADINHGRLDLLLTEPQAETMDEAIRTLKSHNSILSELAPRFGKTTWAMGIFDHLDEQVMVVGSYVLSSHSSFKKDSMRFKQFNDMIVLDLKSDNFILELDKYLKTDRKIIILVSLHKSETLQDMIGTISAIKDKFMFIDEADFGAHKETAINIINSVGYSKLILATGTNATRAHSSHTIDHYQGVTYFDMLYSKHNLNTNGVLFKPQYLSSKYKIADNMDAIPNVDFFQVDFSSVAKEENDLNPSWSKIMQDPYKAKGFIVSAFKTLFNGESINMEYMNIHNIVKDDITGIMAFLPGKKSSLKQLAEIIEEQIGNNWKIICLTGDETTGSNAEKYTETAIKEATEEGKKLLVLSLGLGSRSFSIPSINTVLLMYDNGSAATTGQKMSRCLTRGNNINKIGHIISVSLDPTRDDKLDEAILVTAIKTAEKENSDDFVNTTKNVLRSLNIFMLNENGDRIPVNIDEYTSRILQSKSLTRIVGHTVDLSKVLGRPDFIQKLLKVQGGLITLGRAESIAELGRKFLANEKPKTKKKNMTDEDREARDIIDKIKNAVTTLANQAHHVTVLGKASTFSQAIKNIIDSPCKEDDNAFLDFFGVEVDFARELIDDGIINTRLLDLIVHQYVEERQKESNEIWSSNE